MAWAKSVTATGNPLGVDFGGRVRRDETSGLTFSLNDVRAAELELDDPDMADLKRRSPHV